MTVGGANFNNNFGDYGVGPLKGRPTDVKTSEVETTDTDAVKDRAAQLKAGLEGSGALGTVGTVESLGVAGNVVKTENTSKLVEVATTAASAIDALFGDNQVFNEIASTEDNFATNFANQSLLLAANRSNPEALGADDVLESSKNVLDGNEQLLAAALG